MRTLSFCIAALAALAFGAEPEADRLKRHFKSDNFTVTWGTAPTYEPNAELEIGGGNGHGGTLDWLRFQPRKDGVEVLSIQFDRGWQPYRTKWPPDRAPVAIEHARMKGDAYAALLRDLAIVGAVKLQPIEPCAAAVSSGDFWVHVRLTANKRTLLDLDWAGYEGDRAEVDYAKPRAAVVLARDAVETLNFADHTLTEEERGWASAKFSRDWKRFKGLDFHWWVRERYIITVGIVGDATALPTLRDILKGDPKDRCVYHAINAVTRLTKKDVRDKPVEEMDVENTRRRVLDLLRNEK